MSRMFLKSFAGIIMTEATWLLIMITGLHNLLKMKFTKKRSRYVISVMAFLLAFAFTAAGRFEEFSVHCGLLMDAVVVLLVFDEKPHKKLLLFLCCDICVSAIMALLFNFIGLIPNVDVGKIMDGVQSRTILHVALIGVIIILSKPIKQVNIKKISWYNLLMLSIIMLCWMLVLLSVIVARRHNPDRLEYIFLSVCSIIGGIATLTALLVLIFTDMSRKYYRERQLFQSKIIKMQSEYYNRLYEENKKIRRFRHDMNAIMDCIEQLEEEKDYAELKKLVQQIIPRIKELPEKEIDTGNKIVNAMMNRLYQEAKKDNISIMVKGCLPDGMEIPDLDLCVLFFNALSNAIEACGRLNNAVEKNIIIRIKSYGSALEISMENPVAEPVDIQLLGTETVKGDKSNHGFGILNMKEMVEKYHGEIDFINQNGGFKVVVIFYDVASRQKMPLQDKVIDNAADI